MTLLLLLACSPDTPAPADTADTEDTAPAGPTYHHDVQPILQRACVRCHADAGSAPSLERPEDVVRLAPLIQSYTAAGLMPPPAPSRECHDYQDGERFTITDEERALLSAWADAGAPLGDPADAVVWEGGTPTIAPFDAELVATSPYAPDFSGDGNDYRCFLLDVGNAEAAYVTGMEALVDNLQIVHHVVLFSSDRPVTTDDGTDPRDGFACDGLGEPGWAAVGAWAPGAGPTVFPEGTGIPLAANAQLVLQMHYFAGVEGAQGMTDQSGYGLTLTDQVDSPVLTLPAGPTSFTIPAGDADYRASERYRWRGDAVILGAWPHMHLLGKTIEQTVTHADGTEDCVLSQSAWDYHNQVMANFVEPIPLGTGDSVQVTCHWDNSAANPNQVYDPPVDVPFGERTDEEMCFVFAYVAEL